MPNDQQTSELVTAQGESQSLSKGWISSQHFLLVLAAIAAMGFALRLASILSNGMWNDELVTLRRVTEGWSDFAHWYQAPDPHPPLYYLTLRFVSTVTLGSVNETGLRVAGLGSFLATAGALAWFGIRYSWTRIALIVVAALVAVSPSHIYLGAELRMYGMSAGLSLLLVLLAIDWADAPKASCCRMMVFGGVAAALAFTHYSGLLVAACVYLAVLVTRLLKERRFDLRLVGAGVVTAVVFAPILPVFVQQLEFIDATLYSTELGEATGFVAWAFGAVGLVAGLGAAMAGVIAMRQHSTVRRTPIESAAVAVPLLSAAFVIGSMVLLSIYRDTDLFNFGISLVPPIFVVFGLAAFAQRWVPRTLLWGTAAAAVLMVPLSFVVNQEPANYEPNRVSTLDSVSDSLAELGGLEGIDGELTIIHIDWAATNAYFEEKARERYPETQIITISIQDHKTLADRLQSGLEDGSMDNVMVVSRLPQDSRILPQIPATALTRIVDPNAIFVTSRE